MSRIASLQLRIEPKSVRQKLIKVSLQIHSVPALPTVPVNFNEKNGSECSAHASGAGACRLRELKVGDLL